MMKSLPQTIKHFPVKLGLLLATPVIALLASCATPSGPVAHRHGDIVHSHVLGDTQHHEHIDSALKPKSSATKNADKKTAVAKTGAKRSKITPAKPEDIKLMGPFHQHHNHIDPVTGLPTAPC